MTESPPTHLSRAALVGGATFAAGMIDRFSLTALPFAAVLAVLTSGLAVVRSRREPRIECFSLAAVAITVGFFARGELAEDPLHPPSVHERILFIVAVMIAVFATPLFVVIAGSVAERAERVRVPRILAAAVLVLAGVAVARAVRHPTELAHVWVITALLGVAGAVAAALRRRRDLALVVLLLTCTPLAVSTTDAFVHRSHPPP